jgi:hypothetical protein
MKKLEPGSIIPIVKDTELNTGTHEDADFIQLTENLNAIVLGPEKDSAILVQLLDSNGNPLGDPIYYHQPAH